MTEEMVAAERLTLDAFADQCEVHPDFVRRLVALGLLDPADENDADLWMNRNDVATLARIQRLHDGLSLNYAAVGVVMELLGRIDTLESEITALKRRLPEAR